MTLPLTPLKAKNSLLSAGKLKRSTAVTHVSSEPKTKTRSKKVGKMSSGRNNDRKVSVTLPYIPTLSGYEVGVPNLRFDALVLEHRFAQQFLFLPNGIMFFSIHLDFYSFNRSITVKKKLVE